MSQSAKHLSLKDAPALIERLLPVQKLSAESYKEQMAVQSDFELRKAEAERYVFEISDQGTGIAPTLERRYGLNPAMGAVR